MNQTTLLSLGQPLSTEKYNVAVQNNNMNIIDNAISELQKTATTVNNGLMSSSDKSKIDGIENKYATKAIVTQTSNGLMSYNDKLKLDSIDEFEDENIDFDNDWDNQN